MKNKIALLILLAVSFAMNVKAEIVNNVDVDDSVYIIGTYMYTRETNSSYDGVLTTKRIMIASKTISGNQESDMVVYYKKPGGNWIDGVTGEALTPPTTFVITHVNLVESSGSGSSGATNVAIDGGTKLKATSQNLSLKCSNAVAYYFGTSEPTSASQVTTTTDLTNLNSSGGLTKTINAAGTYWLACKDSAGNFEKTNIVINSYKVYNLLEKLNGTTGIYTSSNYESVDNNTYYAKNGTRLTLESIYTVPTAASVDTFQGYSTTYGATQVELSDSSSPILNDNMELYEWFNRETYSVKVIAHAGGTCAANTVTQSNNSVSTTSDLGYKYLTVKHGDTVRAMATADSGYSFNEFIGYITGSTNPTTGVAVTTNREFACDFTELPPVEATIEGGTTLKVTSQELKLKCENATAYYFGITEPTSASSITNTSATDLAKINSTNGLSMLASPSGNVQTYWLGCRDASGSYAKTSIKLVKYIVYNLIDTYSGTVGVYTSANYVIHVGDETPENNPNYYAKEGTVLTLASIYDIPVDASANTFRGYSTTKGSTAVVPSKTAPTLSGSLMSLYMWFDRVTYTLNVTKPIGGTCRVETVEQSNNSATASTTEVNLIVKSGDRVRATGTASTGYLLDSFTGYINVEPDPGTIPGWETLTEMGGEITTNKQLTCHFADVYDPTFEVTVSNGTTYSQNKTATVTLRDVGSGLTATQYAVYYKWSATELTCNDLFLENGIGILPLTPTDGASSATLEIGRSNLTGAGKIYACIKQAITDKYGNSLAANQLRSADMYMDNTPPTCSWGNWDKAYMKAGETAAITLTCDDNNSGINMDLVSSDVVLSNTNAGMITNVVKGGTATKRTYTFTLTAGSTSGTPLLTLPIYKVQDVAGNKINTSPTSSSIIVDSSAPTLTISVPNGTTYSKSKDVTITLADSNSGLAAGERVVFYKWSTTVISSCDDLTVANGAHSVGFDITDGTKSISKAITVDGNDGQGTIYACIKYDVRDKAGNIYPAKTLVSADAYLDNESPVLSIFIDNGNVYEQTKSAMLQISDELSGLAASERVVFYKWSTTEISSCDDLTVVNGAGSVRFEIADGDRSKHSTVELSGKNANGAGKLYACIKYDVRDKAGNIYPAKTLVSADAYLDNESPVLSIFVDNGNIYEQRKSAMLQISDEVSGLAAGTRVIFYKWSITEISSCDDLTVANGAGSVRFEIADGDRSKYDTIVLSSDGSASGAGKLYACIKYDVRDKAGNVYPAQTLVSADMYLATTTFIECYPYLDYINGGRTPIGSVLVNTYVACETLFPAGSSGSNNVLYEFDLNYGSGLEFKSAEVSSSVGTYSSSGSEHYYLKDGEQVVAIFNVIDVSDVNNLYIELANFSANTSLPAGGIQTRRYLH